MTGSKDGAGEGESLLPSMPSVAPLTRPKITRPGAAAPIIAAPTMRHYDISVLCNDTATTVIKVHAKSPPAAIRTALYTIERDWQPADQNMIVCMAVKAV
jgi:hypothetical protein